MFKRILVATDGSALSKKAVTSAIALAAQAAAPQPRCGSGRTAWSTV